MVFTCIRNRIPLGTRLFLGGVGELNSFLMFGHSNLMCLLDKPVPGSDTELVSPLALALNVHWNGPSLIDLV